MKLFQKPSDDNQYIVSLDIGTEYSKALIAKLNGDDLEIIGVGRARQEVGNMFGGAIADTGEVVAASDDDGGDDDADPDPRRIKRSQSPAKSVNPSASALLRKPAVLAETGISKSTLYQNIANGLFTKPVKIGARASGWPAHEVHAINAARIAGKTDKQIMALVDSLETARKAAA